MYHCLFLPISTLPKKFARQHNYNSLVPIGEKNPYQENAQLFLYFFYFVVYKQNILLMIKDKPFKNNKGYGFVEKRIFLKVILFAYGNCVIIINSTVFGLYIHNVHLISIVIISLSRLSINIKYHPFCTQKYLD